MKGPAVPARLLVVLAVLLLLALSACGGSGDATSTPSSAAPSQEAAASPSTSPRPTWSPTMSSAPIPVVEPGQKLPAFSEFQKLFAYDTSEPFDTSLGDFPFEELGATFTPISYSVNGGQAAGYLVLPDGEGPFPVVVYAPGHGDWMGVSRWNKSAARLAKKGYAGLLLEESGGPFWRLDGQGDVRAFVEYVVQERRGLDLLETMPQIDADRIGFVGYSTGAILGGLLSGLDPRIKAFALDGMHNGDVTTWPGDDSARERLESKGVSPEAYAAQMAIVDPTIYLSRNRGAAILFLWGKEGDIATPSLQRKFVAAAGRSASVFMHSRGHGIWPDGRRALEAWIVENL